jgi:pyruvate dehydrogenase E2 component (dihydrolipoamide acetyltransferase)
VQLVNVEIKVPDIGADTVEVTEILVKVGDEVKLEEGLITVEGQKASMEVPAPMRGIIKEITVKIGTQVNTGDLMMIFEVQDNDNLSVPILEEKKNVYKNNIHQKKLNNIHASPLIRRLARELDINLEEIHGTGPKNRILKEDLENYKKNNFKKEDINLDDSTQKLNCYDMALNNVNELENIELNYIQRISGEKLCESWRKIPHVTQFYKSDITELDAFRKKCNIEYEHKTINIKLTILVFIIKVVARALQEFPRFNSSLSDDKKKLVLKRFINIGIAVDTPKGLLVPVLKSIENKNLLEISRQLIIFANKAREGNLTLSDMQDGCFTISNLGGIGGTGFTPIINMPEIGILGISKSSIQPIWNKKEFVPRLILPLSLSYDHRVIDGVYAAHFMNFINKLLVDIRFMMM